MIQLRKDINKAGEFIINEIIQLIRNSLQNENGKYSSKNIMVASSFNACQFYFYFLIFKTGTVPLELLNSFLYIAFGTAIVSSGTNLISKKIDNPTTEPASVNINDPSQTNITVEK